MNQHMGPTTARGSHRSRRGRIARTVIASAAVLGCGAAQAFEIETDTPDLKLRWDNTFKYSNAFRTKDRSDRIMADFRTDDGDQNFSKGLISNRIDLLTEFDASYKNLGARLSGAAWYDTVYNKRNDNGSPATSNNTSVPFNEFTEATRDRMGRDAELRDAFVFAKGSVGDVAGTLRLGQHSVIFGETLFFGGNGIANAQGPIDLVKLLNVPGTEYKEVLRPVPQVSGQFQLTPRLSLGAYYQFRWEKTVLPPAGSYLSTLDFVGEGAESVVPPGIVSPNGLFNRRGDLEPKNSGQGGLQLRYRFESIDAELGLYAARYHDKTPQIYLTLDGGFNPDGLVHAYAQNIRTYGASLSTTFGDFNLAGEVSVRHNVPLVTDPQVILPIAPRDNDSNPAYAVGKTMHVNVSTVYNLPQSPLWDGGFLLGEIAWNRRLSIDANRAAMDPNTTRDAWALRFLFLPSYYQVMPGLDITVPIGLGYNPGGKSSAIFAFNGGVRRGGDFSLGVNGEYNKVWQFGVNWVHFLGDADSFLTPPNDNAAFLSYKQALKDRDFISLNVKRTF
jgi:hypothetical protein